MWTKIFDYSSGGRQKTEFGVFYIEAPMQAARLIFNDLHPSVDLDHETCKTCGGDFSVEEETDAERLSGLQYFQNIKIFSLDRSEMTEPQLGLCKYFDSKAGK